MIPERNTGKEQAYIKHELLRAYLERLFMTIGQRESKICYVDCFSLPGQEAGKDFEETSIGVTLEIMQKCYHGLLAGKLRKDVHFRVFFHERYKKSHTELEKFLNTHAWDGVTATSRNCDFNDLRDEVASWCGKNDFCFFFIDPKGLKDAAIPTLRPLLTRPKSEFLINFMYPFFARAQTLNNFEKHAKAMLGGVPDTPGVSTEDWEKIILRLYYQALTSSAAVVESDIPRCAHYRVPHPILNRPIYDLIYLTRHPIGILTFMGISEDFEAKQEEMRDLAVNDSRQKKSAQLELFSQKAPPQKQEKQKDLKEIKDYWLGKLSAAPRRFGVNEFADMLEETGWFMDDFQKAFFELEFEGRARNLASTGKRSKHAVHYWANGNRGELLEKV